MIFAKPSCLASAPRLPGLDRARLRKRRPTQAQGVGDHRDAREAHRGGGKHRAQDNPEKGVEQARREGNAESVVAKGEGQVLADVRQGVATELVGAGEGAQVALDEGDACALATT